MLTRKGKTINKKEKENSHTHTHTHTHTEYSEQTKTKYIQIYTCNSTKTCFIVTDHIH